MRSNRPVLLVLVVVLSLSQAALVAGTGTGAGAGAELDTGGAVVNSSGTSGEVAATALVRNVTDTTNYLVIEDGAVERERFGNQSLDVGRTLAADAYRLRARQRSTAFEHAFDRAPNGTARVAIARAEIARVETRIGRLERRQERALAAFNDGDIDDEQFLGRLVAVHVEARQLEGRLRTVREASQQRIGFRLPTDLVTRIDNVRARLVPLDGAVRAHTGRVFAGEREDTSVYVLTSGDGIVLAAVDDRTFRREAYLADRRESGSPDQFDDGDLPRVSVANQRAAELYPWIYDIPAPPSIRAFGNSSVYNVSDSHPHGTLIAYLDGATTEVYREVQLKRLDALPTRNRTAANGTLRLTASRTHATGPLGLSVADTGTGDPVDAAVSIDGQRVGSTGSDGMLWTVTPHDDVRVTVRTETGVVRMRFSARV